MALAPVSSMAPLHALGQDDKNEAQYDFIGHVIPLVLASVPCDADINDTTAFLRSRQLKMTCNMTFWSCDTIGAGINVL